MAKSQQFVSGGAVAGWLNLSTRRVRELAAAGVIIKQGRDKYDLKASVRAYATHVREQAAGRVGIDPTTDISAVNIRLKEANIRLANLRYDKESGSLIERAALLALWGPIMRGIVQRRLAYPGKFAFEIPTLTAHDKSVMEGIIRADLEDAALGRGFDFGAAAADDPPEEEGDDHAV
jgi:terminase small subunit / prophage DNA-packing protein